MLTGTNLETSRCRRGSAARSSCGPRW
ncbi:hypothetical protein BN13_570010 [Nostocoides jenkinsii Ben 74]|uniref:Uncharacterized protein n=1 Tax=Nostocoides jenkinsii Ben 74 TaxID=1193518 RepID=A0A077MDR3_9MICO|nr:hypothetical protein BN13_570010 [Tetrasphaera jenkinsii Ben 74]